ncbi:MAG: outer membrane lipoprotein-sorting protein [bacterium]|nr:outer membrane lipoprotein-sorting protein [bacterium]
MKKKGLLIILIVTFSVQSLFALTANQIMKKNDALKEPRSAKSLAVMKIYRKGRLRETKEFQMLSKKVGTNTRSLIKFIKPTKIKFLTHTYKGRDDNQWLKTRSGKPKKIASGDKGKPFVHSHFFYEDLGSRELHDYKYKKLADGTAAGADCYKIESVRKRGKKVYDKAVLYVRKSDFFVMRVDFYKKGKFLKYLENHNIQKIKGILTPKKTVMQLKNGKGKTIITIKSVKYNIRVVTSTFNKRSL